MDNTVSISIDVALEPEQVFAATVCFYDDDALFRLGRSAGFESATVLASRPRALCAQGWYTRGSSVLICRQSRAVPFGSEEPVAQLGRAAVKAATLRSPAGAGRT